jgi:hypothetical protein
VQEIFGNPRRINRNLLLPSFACNSKSIFPQRFNRPESGAKKSEPT